jgi:hypothetical protein
VTIPIQPAAPRTTLDLSSEEWREVVHLQPQDVTTNDDVAHSDAVDGGYRLSTVAGPAGSSGALQSATVWLNGGRDSVTMNGDGTYAVVDAGKPIDDLDTGDGGADALSGGAYVTLSEDGSVGIQASAPCRFLKTSLRATGSGVDVVIGAEMDPTCGPDIFAKGIARNLSRRSADAVGQPQ